MPFPSDPNYNILYTDYDTVSVVYACDALTQIQTAWILSREPVMAQEEYERAKKIVADKVRGWDFEAHIEGL